jgi:Lipase (class 3)
MKSKLIYSLSALCFALMLNAQLPNSNLVKQGGTVLQAQTAVLLNAADNSVFTTKFNPNAAAQDNVNAYLLCYLSTMIYPQYLLITGNGAVPVEGNDAHNLHTDTSLFMKAFKQKTSSLFRSPQYTFINKSSTSGYDPEAMIINTPRDLYVIFRGTDRVGSNEIGSLGYSWSEWIKTDFNFFQKTDALLPNAEIKAHGGMLESVKFANFFTELLNKLREDGLGSKKLWITGHSLGGGQAQIFAMMLAKQNIIANGLYVYAAPNPGNVVFAQRMNSLYGSKFQRFEFVKDPVTSLTGIFGSYFTPAGKRVYYDDVNDPAVFEARERTFPNVLSVIAETLPGMINFGIEQIPGPTNKKFSIGGMASSSNFCYHHPNWYLNAAFNQLTSAEKNGLPLPLGNANTSCEACNSTAVTRGFNSQQKSPAERAGETLEDIGEFFGSVTSEADAIARNTNHTMITPGVYNIRCLKGGKYLAIKGACSLENNCAFGLYAGQSGNTNNLTYANYKFAVEPNLIGYAIKQYGTDKVLDIAAGQILNNGTLAKTWSLNTIPPTPNQAWMFYRLGNSNRYMMKNIASQKYLAANRNRVNEDGCEVLQWDRGTTDQYIWILEPVN